MTTAVTKEDLLKKRFGVEDFEIPGVGLVKIKPLSRAEAMSVQGTEIPVIELERYILSKALVEPKMTEADVQAWQESSPAGELEPLLDRVVEISGMKKAASKEAVKSFRG